MVSNEIELLFWGRNVNAGGLLFPHSHSAQETEIVMDSKTSSKSFPKYSKNF